MKSFLRSLRPKGVNGLKSKYSVFFLSNINILLLPSSAFYGPIRVNLMQGLMCWNGNNVG